MILKSQNIEDKNYVLDHNNCLLEERKPKYNIDNHDHYELMCNLKKIIIIINFIVYIM